MNYRHAYHAGNHADVLKHALTHLALDRLLAKAKPIVAIDAFAGGGLVDLQLDDRALRTGEWRNGAGRIWPAAREEAEDEPELAPYRDALALRNPSGALRYMPGSPLQLLDRLRAQDKLLAVEKQEEEADALHRLLEGDKRARVYRQDGWEALKSFLPPTPRRGLALIDPPFEERGEYERLAASLADGLRRWATGVFLLWHPVKDLDEAARYEAALREAAGETPLLLCELRVKPAGEGGLLGSGMAVANAPYGLDARAEALGATLLTRLAAPGGAWRSKWLVAPK